MRQAVGDPEDSWDEDAHPTEEELAVAAEDNGNFPAIVARVRKHCGTCDDCTEILAGLKRSPSWRPS